MNVQSTNTANKYNNPENLKKSLTTKQEVLFFVHLFQFSNKLSSSLAKLTFHDNALNDVVPLKEQPFVAEKHYHQICIVVNNKLLNINSNVHLHALTLKVLHFLFMLLLFVSNFFSLNCHFIYGHLGSKKDIKKNVLKLC